jgi:hypothetical protein
VGRPRRADGRLAEPQPAAALLDDVDRLTVDDGRAAEIRRERVGVRDGVRVQRGGEADRDDQQEERERRESDAVPREPARGETPRALAGDLP